MNLIRLLSFVPSRTVHLTAVLPKKVFDRSPLKYTKPGPKSTSLTMTGEDEFSEVLANDDAQFSELTERMFLTPQMGHQVFVIQPYIKWGHKKKRNTTPELQLSEATTLVKTLNKWQVVDSCIISLQSMDQGTFFGKGNLQSIAKTISLNRNISAVFLSVDMLKVFQRKYLEEAFKVPVYDRYLLIIQIFREHAKTREAKLQIQLAELPYVWASVGGSGEGHKQFIKDQESKLKQKISELRAQRAMLRNNRVKRQFPVVAVVGYTNAGKTSLIKALTESKSLVPEDKLFATLDVTVHEGVLPCRLHVLYLDTIGFIADIPTTLLESFVATLEDALLADVIVHVRDVVHPDTVAQSENVMETLRKFNLAEATMEHIITVGNKIDQVDDAWRRGAGHEGLTLVSAKDGTGIDVLREEVEAAVLQVTGRQAVSVRVASGGEEYLWLHREAAVSSVAADPNDAQFVFVNCVISGADLARFKHRFIGSARNKAPST